MESSSPIPSLEIILLVIFSVSHSHLTPFTHPSIIIIAFLSIYFVLFIYLYVVVEFSIPFSFGFRIPNPTSISISTRFCLFSQYLSIYRARVNPQIKFRNHSNYWIKVVWSDYNLSHIVYKMKKVCAEYYGYCLPIELIHEVLTWLPGSALLRFKCVSKSWYCLISDPKFIKLNLAKSLKTNSNTSFMLESFARLYKLPANQIYFNFSLSNPHHFFHPNNLVVTPLSHPNDGIIFKPNKPVTSSVVGSCHGLVCIEYVFSVGIYNRFLIYNPTTRASKILPELEFSRRYACILGFGYDCVSDDYKVLSTWNLGYSDDGSLWKSMYYSLKTDAWETVDNPPWDGTLIGFRCPVFVNNSFHWLPCEGKEIKCFSLSTRSYYEIPIPEKIHHRLEKLDTRIPSTNRLTEFKGQLCVVTSFFDIWMLKEYGNSESWTQVFHNTESLLIVTYYKGFPTQNLRVDCFQDDHSNYILLVTRCCFGGQSPLWLYCDGVSGTTKEIEMPSFPEEVGLADSQPWVESLVPLHQSIKS